MGKITYRLSLDMRRQACQDQLNMRKRDSERRIIAAIQDGAAHYHIADDCRAVFAARKPDGNVIFNDCQVTNCEIIYDVTEQTTAVPGITECEIRLYSSDGGLVTSPKFTIAVEDTVYDDGDEIESTSEFSALTKALAEVNVLIEKVKTILDLYGVEHEE